MAETSYCIAGYVVQQVLENLREDVPSKHFETLVISEGKSVQELLEFMEAHEVPLTAQIVPRGDGYDYEGIELEWEAR